jgi:hypothetical protein
VLLYDITIDNDLLGGRCRGVTDVVRADVQLLASIGDL